MLKKQTSSTYINNVDVHGRRQEFIKGGQQVKLSPLIPSPFP